MRMHPLPFRRDEVHNVAMRFKANESASLIGVGSVGKSNLLHHITRSDVLQYYLGEHGDNIYPIMVDPNLLGATEGESVQFRCWAGYELLMHRMFYALQPFKMLGEDAPKFYKAYQELQNGSNPLYQYMGLRYFEVGLDYFFQRKIKLVFMFDEFEELLQSMPPRFFQTLRGLRDTHKSYLSYLTFSREPIPVLVRKMDLPYYKLEPFMELFTDNVLYVGPYNQVDAYAMTDSLLERNPEMNISRDAVEFLHYASGRFAGILRAGFRELEILGDISPSQIHNPKLVERLALRSRIRTECETIWLSLTDTEQNILASVAQDVPDRITDESESAIARLVQKHVLYVDRQRRTLQIRPPVLHYYIHSIVS